MVLRKNNNAYIYLMAAIGALVISMFAMQRWYEIEERKILSNSLKTVLEATHQSISSWSHHHLRSARTWAGSDNVINAAAALSAASFSQSSLQNNQHQKNLRAWLTPYIQGEGYLGYFIVSNDYQNLASMRDENIGAQNLLVEQMTFMKRIWSGETVVSHPQLSDVMLGGHANLNGEGNMATMFAGAPVRNAAGEIIAAFLLRIDPYADFSKILEQGRLGGSGETYVFDRRGRMLSESRFNATLYETGRITEASAMLNLRLLEEGGDERVDILSGTLLPHVEHAITYGSGLNINGYTSYQGGQVVGAWLWDSQLNMGFVTEMSHEEGYRHVDIDHIVSAIYVLFGALLLYWMVHMQRKNNDALKHEINLKTDAEYAMCKQKEILEGINELHVAVFSAEGKTEVFQLMVEKGVILTGCDTGLLVELNEGANKNSVTYTGLGGGCDVRTSPLNDKDEMVWQGLIQQYENTGVSLISASTLALPQAFNPAEYGELLIYMARLSIGEHVVMVFGRVNDDYSEGDVQRLIPFFSTCGSLVINACEQQRRRRAEHALHDMVSTTAGYTGEDYFDHLTKNLSSVTGMKFTMVAELQGTDSAPTLRSLSVWKNNEFASKMEFDIKGTHVEPLLVQSVFSATRYVANLFEKDSMVRSLGVQSCIGVALKDQDQNVIGFLLAAHDAPLSNDFVPKSIMMVLAARVSAEMMRMKAQKKTNALLSSNEQLLSHLIKVQEEERRYLSRELHDEFGQWLSAIQAEAQLISDLSEGFEGKFEQIHEVADLITNNALAMHDVIRSMINQLRPQLLDEFGFHDSIEHMVEQWGVSHPGIKVDLLLPDDVSYLSSASTITLYRIIQEALTNISKHAHASRIAVRMWLETHNKGSSDIFCLEIADDGKGMDMSWEFSRGSGVKGIRERITAIGGVFKIKSEKGLGTQVLIRMPMLNNQEGVSDERNDTSLAS